MREERKYADFLETGIIFLLHSFALDQPSKNICLVRHFKENLYFGQENHKWFLTLRSVFGCVQSERRIINEVQLLDIFNKNFLINDSEERLPAALTKHKSLCSRTFTSIAPE